MKFRILLGLLLCGFAFAAAAASQWQLNPTYYPAKMPMTVVFPRPDSEITSTIARQQYAYADGNFQYRIPITIQGGAYPYYVDTANTTGLPSNMAISSDPNSPDYMTAIWTPAANATGTYNCVVAIKDQAGNEVYVKWTVTIDNSKFIFIDPTATANGTGTESSPLDSMSGLSVANGTGTSSYAGKIIVLMHGTTKFVGHETGTNTAGDYIMKSGSGNANNPYIFIGYPGQNAVLDMNYSGAFRNGGQDDVYFGDLTIENAKQNWTPDGTEYDTVAYFDWAKTNRTTFFENTFSNFKFYSGSGRGSNQAAILTWNPNAQREYWSVTRNTMDNYNIALVDLFCIKYGVLDNNNFTGNGSNFPLNGAFNIKSDNQDLSIRRNTYTAATFTFTDGFIRLATQAQTFVNDNIEVAYNIALVPNNSYALRFLMSGQLSEDPHIWVYRNTFSGNLDNFDHTGIIVLEDNIIVNNYNAYSKLCGYYGSQTTCTQLSITDPTFSSTTTTDGNIFAKTSDGDLDSSGNLAGSAAQYFGEIGYQIGGTPPLSAPTWQ